MKGVKYEYKIGIQLPPPPIAGRIKHTAFTLAEVLVTLGIIGIVAALTLPSIITKYQNIVLQNQFKKEFSTLLQAFQKAENDIGGSSDCYIGGSNTNCTDLMKSFLKNMKVVKKCEGSDNVLLGCMPEYTGIEAVHRNNGATQEEIQNTKNNWGRYTSGSIKERWSYVFADGAIFMTYSNNYPNTFLIDINGKKGPNKWGHDLHGMQLYKKNINQPYNFKCNFFPLEDGGSYPCRELSGY